MKVQANVNENHYQLRSWQGFTFSSGRLVEQELLLSAVRRQWKSTDPFPF
jgi:hypothetical protein